MVRVIADNTKSSIEKPLGFFAQWAEDVHCVFGRDPAAHSVWEILLTYSGVHAVLMYRISHRLRRADWKLTARFLGAITKLFKRRNSSGGKVKGPKFRIGTESIII